MSAVFSGKYFVRKQQHVEDQLLLVLEYWREYRTQFHIATSWGISESAGCRLIAKVETLLMQSGKFRQQAQETALSEC